ncbi:MAG: NAD(P)H-binding protein [Cellvibrionales bacterium]|nr:NAD(P)H-binding protein [Cellvibrionales bacterium]
METGQSAKALPLTNSRIGLLGCGDIGTRLYALLERQGAEVTAIRRHIDGIKHLHAKAMDFADAASVGLLKDFAFDYVVITLVPDRTEPNREAAYQKGYVDNLTRILSHLDPSKLKRIFWVSSTSVYAQTDNQWVDESSEANPQSVTGKLLREAENVLEASPIDSTVVRFSGIYRSDRYRYLDKLKAHQLPAKATTNYFMNRIHVDDCARLLAFLLEKAQKGAVDGLYNGTDSHPVDYETFVNFLSDKMQLPLNDDMVADAPSSFKKIRNNKIVDAGFRFNYPSYQEGLVPLFHLYQ